MATVSRPTPLLRRLLGEALRRARQEQGRTLRDVASAADVSIQYLSEVERGRKEASSEVLAAICRALGLELADLLAAVLSAIAPTPAATPIIGFARAAQVTARPTAGFGGVRLLAA